MPRGVVLSLIVSNVSALIILYVSVCLVEKIAALKCTHIWTVRHISTSQAVAKAVYMENLRFSFFVSAIVPIFLRIDIIYALFIIVMVQPCKQVSLPALVKS